VDRQQNPQYGKIKRQLRASIYGLCPTPGITLQSLDPDPRWDCEPAEAKGDKTYELTCFQTSRRCRTSCRNDCRLLDNRHAIAGGGGPDSEVAGSIGIQRLSGEPRPREGGGASTGPARWGG